MGGETEAARRAQRRVGQTFGKYRAERVLGIGGMATVYLAVHRNGHRVALKLLNAELSADEDIRARFVREGYATNAIPHPGAVRVLDDDQTEDGAPFLVMELLDGETLQARMLRSGGALPVREVLALAYQLTDTVAVAHDKGILHRDLKPDNLLLTRDGLLKVLDFGVARMTIPGSGSDPTRTGRTMGTPAFMAPEQAFGKTREVDVRSDLWSIGATMFTLLSGQHVHDAENAAQLLVIAATSAARSLASVAPSVPVTVVAIVDRACAFERAARFDDARAMQRAIAEVYRAEFGADVGSAVVTVTASRVAAESAPTLDVSEPSFPSRSTPSAVSKRQVTVPRRSGWARAALAVGVASLAAFAIALGARRVRSPVDATIRQEAASSACASSAACGGRTVCRAGACVAVESEDCAALARPEDFADDGTVWLGAMFAKDGPMAVDFDGAIRSVELARRDFLEVTNGLPAGRPGGAPRPIGLVVCNDARDPLRAARHLADDVRVPAIVGFSRSKEVTDLAAAVFNPRHVAAFASNTASMLSAIPPPPGEPRMVWRTTLSATMRVSVMAALVREVLEPELKAHVVKKGEALRVAVLNIQNTTGMSAADAIASSLRFNGKSISENGEDFLLIVRDDARPEGDEVQRFVRELIAFRPHVVIDLATNGSLVVALEAAWKGPVRPRYIGAGMVDEFWAKNSPDPELGRRIFDVEPGAKDTANAKFDLRYAAIFDPKTNPTHSVTGGPYDAFYALAYAIVALGDVPVTGPDIARALGRLAGPGPRIDVGPGGIFAATSALARGETIDLEGTLTSLDFDPTTGDPTVSFTVSCAKRGREGVALVDTGLAWDGRKRGFVGEMRCP